MKKKLAAIPAMALLLVAAAAVPAGAAAGVATGTSNGPVPFVSAAECTIAATVTTDLVTVTYVVRGTAESAGPAISTRVGCVVYDQYGNRTGGCAGALPGPFATCVGTATGILHIVPKVCAEVESRYANGSIGGSRPCP